MSITRHLTRQPRTAAGQALRRLAMDLSTVRDETAAIEWQLRLEQWWQASRHLTRERTMFRNGQWGFTHDRLRKAWLLLRLVTRRQALFTHIVYGTPRTTSALESLNAQIRDLLRRHRGMSEEHRRRAVEWFLTLRELPLEHALDLARPAETAIAEAPTEPPLGPALNTEEGLWLRTGWAGRS